jgi:uncharacterized protein with PIN domain
MVGAFILVGYMNSDYRPDKPEVQFLLIMVPMMALGLLAITLKCECCGRGLFDLENEEPKDSFKTLSLKIYFLPKRCPKCGCERY